VVQVAQRGEKAEGTALLEAYNQSLLARAFYVVPMNERQYSGVFRAIYLLTCRSLDQFVRLQRPSPPDIDL
jgi:hypothetical protein